jgi:putative membrane protein
MRLILCAVCCFALASISALAQDNGTSKAGLTDQQFVNMAAQTDMVEANIGQMAADSASAQEVKDYAQMLVTDHTADYQQLKTAAQQANLTVPDSIDAEHYKMMVAPFTKLKGAAFDKKYEQEMVTGHTKALQQYQKEGAGAENAPIKSYAQTAEPVLEKHLSGAKDLEAKPSKPAAAAAK